MLLCPLVYLSASQMAMALLKKGVNTWQSKFRTLIRTLKDHLEHGIGVEVPKDHPVLQWLAWWSVSVLNMVAAKSHGRTVFEHTVGHRMKTPLSKGLIFHLSCLMFQGLWLMVQGPPSTQLTLHRLGLRIWDDPRITLKSHQISSYSPGQQKS